MISLEHIRNQIYTTHLRTPRRWLLQSGEVNRAVLHGDIFSILYENVGFMFPTIDVMSAHVDLLVQDTCDLVCDLQGIDNMFFSPTGYVFLDDNNIESFLHYSVTTRVLRMIERLVSCCTSVISN
jgi:hypothetical protein